jgi:ketosteroid isomerase-like protein
MTNPEQHERRREIVRAFSDPNADRWQHFAPNFRWRMIGTTPVSGVTVGVAGISEQFAPLGRGLAFNKVDVDDVFGEGDRFVKIAHTNGETVDGRPFRNELATIFTFEDDLVVDVLEFVDTALIASVVVTDPVLGERG